MNRRELIGQMAAMGMLSPLSGFTTKNFLSEKDNYLFPDPVSPFSMPPSSTLDPGPTGINMRILIPSSQTENRICCVEAVLAPKKMGPAPHIHEDLDELMFVTEGIVSVLIEGKLYEVAAGGWNFRPRKLEHTFFNRTNSVVRFIDFYTNQNFDEFLEEYVHKIIPFMASKKLTPMDKEVKAMFDPLCERFGITFLFEKRREIVAQYGLNS